MKRTKNGQFKKLSTADRIRKLADKGLSRVEISKELGVKYQTVRNTLVRQTA
jgi:hypothetical protein